MTNPTDSPRKAFSSPAEIAEAAEGIYEDRHRERLEADENAKFVAIDVLDEQAYPSETPEGAMQKARESAPAGVFHLIRVGSPTTFRVSYAKPKDAGWGWPLRRAG